MSFSQSIKQNPTLKLIAHRMIFPRGQAKPRAWVRWFVNPFFHKRGNGSRIRGAVRMDVVPFNRFELGKNAVIESFSVINNGVGDVCIGESSFIGMSNVVIGPVNIGNHIIFAQHVVVSGLNHEYENPDLPIYQQAVSTALITVEDECWIGANVVITAGVTIGKHSVVAAGSVVTKSIPPYSIAVGSPARVIKRYNFETKVWEKV
jgi:acetyltransferase-like isoleucine patch superfamily enzyme